MASNNEDSLPIIEMSIVDPKGNISSLIFRERYKDISFAQACKDILSRWLPAMLGMIIRKCVDISNLVFVGHMANSDFIAGVGLAVMTVSILCTTFTIGIAGGIGTLASQAFGAKNYYLAGCFLNRARVIVTALFVIQAILILNCESILVMLGQPEISAQYASQYLILLLPGLWCMSQFELTRCFLTTQGVYNIIVVIQAITFISHLVCLYIFTNAVELEIAGIAISTCITYCLNFVILTLYITFNKGVVHLESWHFINSDSFIEYLTYGIPSTIMIMLEFWCYEAFVFLSGCIGIDYQSAAVTLINFLSLIYNISVGMGISAVNLVGSSIGAYNPNGAEKYAKVSITLSMIIINEKIFSLFVTHEGIIKILSPLTGIYCIMLIADYIHEVSSGILIAIGRQKIAIIVNLCGYWLIGIPLAVIGYISSEEDNEIKLSKVITGITVGSLAVAAALTILVMTTKWSKVCDSADKRIKQENDQLKQHHHEELKQSNVEINISIESYHEL